MTTSKSVVDDRCLREHTIGFEVEERVRIPALQAPDLGFDIPEVLTVACTESTRLGGVVNVDDLNLDLTIGSNSPSPAGLDRDKGGLETGTGPNCRSRRTIDGDIRTKASTVSQLAAVLVDRNWVSGRKSGG